MTQPHLEARRPPAIPVIRLARTGLWAAALCALASGSVLAQGGAGGAPAPGAASAPAPAGAAPAPDATPRFDILEYVIEGNTVLATEAIERAVYPHLGEKRTVDDVEAARASLERAYRTAGFGTVGVDIPEQRVTGGVVILRVVQGQVSRLRVTGARFFDQGRILALVPSLAEGAVPNLPLVQEQLAAVNRTADRRVTPLLRPGKAPGTTEVDLNVEDRAPLYASVEINNRAPVNTTQSRLSASLRYDNVFQLEHSIGLQLQTSPENTAEVKVLGLSYTIPAGMDSWAFSILSSDSAVAAGVGSTTVFGRGTIYGVRRNVLLALREGEYQSLNVGLDYKSFRETVDAGTGQGFTTPLRYAPLTGGYLALLEDKGGRWQWGGGLTVGLRNFLSRESEFADKRFGATGGFLVLKADLQREQKIGRGFTAWGRVDLQATGQPLVSNEQFVAGGVDSVRGYYESAAVGDSAVRMSFELRTPELLPLPAVDANAPLSAPPPSFFFLRSVRAHAFLDGAALEILKPLPGQTARFNLLGAGFGLRAKVGAYGSLNLNLGHSLWNAGTARKGETRMNASALLEF